MRPLPTPFRFGQHAVAVLSAAILGSTILSLLVTVGLAVSTMSRPMGPAWLAGMAIATWIGVFVIALPAMAIMLSVLWPVTRKGNAASSAICLIGGATAGIVLAPLASARMHGASLKQILFFAATGAALAMIYLVIVRRIGREPSAAAPVTGGVQHRNSDQFNLDI